jgi:hypothetical protein
LYETNKTVCKPPLDSKEVEAIAKSVSRYPGGKPGGNGHSEYTGEAINLLTYRMTDAGNGEAIAEAARGKAVYVFEYKAWYIYSGGRWKQDSNGSMRRLVIRTMRKLHRDSISAAIPDEAYRIKLAKWFITSEGERAVNAGLVFAAAQEGMTIQAADLDCKLWLLNTPNGTIDLLTGDLKEHNPADMLTQQTTANYNPEAQAEEWNQFLIQIFMGDTMLIDYVQRLKFTLSCGVVPIYSILPALTCRGEQWKLVKLAYYFYFSSRYSSWSFSSLHRLPYLLEQFCSFIKTCSSLLGIRISLREYAQQFATLEIESSIGGCVIYRILQSSLDTITRYSLTPCFTGMLLLFWLANCNQSETILIVTPSIHSWMYWTLTC